jgi:hypothetical protein
MRDLAFALFPLVELDERITRGTVRDVGSLHLLKEEERS